MEDNNRQLLDEHLLLNRDLIRDAIHKGRSGLVKELLDQYLLILRDFVVAIKNLGIQYTFEAAQRESGFFSDWAPISQIQQHFLAVFPRAIESQDWEIIDHFMRFPFDVMVLALRNRDHLVFQRYARLYLSFYYHITRQSMEQNLRTSLLERCWRMPVGFYNYQIRPLLEKRDLNEDDAKSLGDYTVYLLVIISDLMKNSLDEKDHRKFGIIATAAREIGEWLGPSPLRAIEYRQLGIPVPGSRDEQIHQEIVGEQLLRVQTTRRKAFLGLGAWLVHLLEVGELEDQEFRGNILIIYPEFMNITELYDVYVSAVIESRSENIFGWGRWELRDRPSAPGQAAVHPLQFSNWLGMFYVLRALELSPLNLEGIPDLEPSVASKGIRDSVISMLEHFEDSELWRSLVVSPNPDEYQLRKRSLIRMHEIAAERQRTIEEDRLIRQELDETIVDSFERDVISFWQETATLRNLILSFGRYEERPEAAIPHNLDARGIMQLDPKGAFATEEGVSYVDWGAEYGRSLARGEDNFLAQSFAALPALEAGIERLERDIYEALQALRGRELSPIILFNGAQVRSTLSQSTDFEPAWRTSTELPSIRGIEGIFDDALVARLSGLSPEEMIIVDLDRFGKLVQYRPDDSGQFPLYISVEEISEGRARELIDAQPDLARDPATGEQLDGEEAMRWFLLRVQVEVYERVRFEEVDHNSGLRIILLGNEI